MACSQIYLTAPTPNLSLNLVKHMTIPSSTEPLLRGSACTLFLSLIVAQNACRILPADAGR